MEHVPWFRASALMRHGDLRRRSLRRLTGMAAARCLHHLLVDQRSQKKFLAQFFVATTLR